jgi:L-serine dehydratase
VHVPLAFATATELLALGQAKGKRIAELMRINELALRSPGEVHSGLLGLAEVMRACVERGLATRGVLPVADRLRRAGANAAALNGNSEPSQWAAAYATAVAEENAAGGSVVAAPSNGSAGPVAAVLYHWKKSTPMAGDDGTVVFLLAAAAVGHLARTGGLRHCGCQGEVGVAAAMAAAGLAAVNNASNSQLLFAAERALDPYKGLTCDPVGGLVQDPCIERNASAAAHAIRAARLGLRQPEPAQVAFDALVRSMVESGRQMAGRYKESSLGGLAVSVVDC